MTIVTNVRNLNLIVNAFIISQGLMNNPFVFAGFSDWLWLLSSVKPTHMILNNAKGMSVSECVCTCTCVRAHMCNSYT